MKAFLKWLKNKFGRVLPKKKETKKPANATYPLW